VVATERSYLNETTCARVKFFSGSTSFRKIARDEIDGSDAQKKAMSRNNYTEKKEREKAERREEARNEKHDAQVK
jgi:hypothetical protein